MKNKYMKLLFTILICHLIFCGDVAAQGYYKDIFMDGGVKVTSRERLPAADFLDMSIEHYASSRYTSTFPPTRLDSLLQEEIYTGTPGDLNGVLLYPDGQPRFRLLYVNGGRATSHGRSLGEKGRSRMQTFISNGGSYVGTCAGAFFVSAATVKADTVFPREFYLHSWPGVARATGLSNSYTGMFVEKNSPLLNYADFGGDDYIDSVRHNGGCYLWTEAWFPPETETLLRYDYRDELNGRSIHKEISAWAYKKDEATGRIVVIGSHPEAVTGGERLDLMASMLLYARDGLGDPVIKGELERKKKREMYKSTADNDPAHTMIGDKQYHHFKINIPRGASNIRIELEGAKGYDLFLYLNKDDFAFKRKAEYKDISEGPEKTMMFDLLDHGTWYLAVECDTSVETEKTDYGVRYTGKTEVLNGVPYSLIINWDE